MDDMSLEKLKGLWKPKILVVAIMIWFIYVLSLWIWLYIALVIRIESDALREVLGSIIIPIGWLYVPISFSFDKAPSFLSRDPIYFFTTLSFIVVPIIYIILYLVWAVRSRKTQSMKS